MAKVKISLERLNHIWVLVCAASFVLFFRLLDLQIIRHKHFKHAAEANRTLVIYKNAPRGKMITCDGTVIAANRPSFSLVYLPGEKRDSHYLKKLSEDFAHKLNVDKKILDEKFHRAFDKAMPVRLYEDLPLNGVFLFSEIKTLYEGIDIVTESKRYYPYGRFASHIIGYMGNMALQDWKNLKDTGRYRLNSLVGKSGLEGVLETYLKGTDGGLYLEVDSKGRLTNLIEDRKWKQGSDIYLTVDFPTQKAAEDGLRNYAGSSGAVIALDPRNGKVLAMASSPDFDPGMLVGGRKDFEQLPEFNYALQGQYEPASTFKIIVAAAALETATIDPKEKVYCPGYYDAGTRVFKCWHKEGHGWLNMLQALTHSCDVYFYKLGLKTGPAVIEKFARGFRLGMPTGISISAEEDGNVFGPSQRAKHMTYWFSGDTLNLSIGQGEILVTPIQMVQIISAVANGGKFWRPYLVEKIVDENGEVLFREKVKLIGSVNLKPETWAILRQGLLNAVEGGTGTLARIEGVDVYGKTGTAQNPRGLEHGWFVAFAETEKSKVAVCVFLEHIGHGYLAAPVAKNVIKASLRLG